jgi:hypothetical protein
MESNSIAVTLASATEKSIDESISFVFRKDSAKTIAHGGHVKMKKATLSGSPLQNIENPLIL